MHALRSLPFTKKKKKTFIALFRGDMKVEYEKKKKLKLPSGLGIIKFVDKVRNNGIKGVAN